MGAQQASCRCGTSAEQGNDRDADCPAQAVVETHDSALVPEPGASSAPSEGSAKATSSASAEPKARSASPAARSGGSKDAAKDGGQGESATAKGRQDQTPVGKQSSERAGSKSKRSSSAKSRQPKAGAGAAEQGSARRGTASAGGGSAECPGMKMAAKVEAKTLTPLQKLKLKKEEDERRARDMIGVVDGIMAGKSGAGQRPGAAGPSLRIEMPTKYERDMTRKMLLESFRCEYQRMARERAKFSGPDKKLEMYNDEEVAGLTIKDGHRAMPRPTDVKLPKDFRRHVGVIPLSTLNRYTCESSRKLLSVYGEIFDVSDRPDKYGEGGPYSWMTGNDITWGFVSGKDVPEEINKFYDMWKIAPKSLQERKLTGLLSWVAFYETEYGGTVGNLKEYTNEAGLKGPPIEECEECCVM